MLNNTIKIKILKVYALSISGIEAEQDTAKKLLDELLKKHAVSLEDVLTSEKPIVGRLYDYSNEYELHLMVQLLESKFHERHSFYIVPENQQLSVSLSESNHIVFDFLFGVYRRAMEKELNKSITNFDQRVENNAAKHHEVKMQYEKLKAKYLKLAEMKDDDMMTSFTEFISENSLFTPVYQDGESGKADMPKRVPRKYDDIKIVPIYNPSSTRKDYEN